MEQALSHKAQVDQAVSFLRPHIKEAPLYGMVLGTGLSALADELTVSKQWNYAEIPHMGEATMSLHKGRLLYGHLEGVPVLLMHGRLHYYEGYSMKAVTFGIRLMGCLGIKRLLLSNVSGGLNGAYQKGDLMLLSDHIDLMPDNPLRGSHVEAWGDRFPDMSAVYDAALRAHVVKEAATRRSIRLHEGVYAALSGPNLETPAEYRYLRTIGADAVGMSTVPEVIVARQMGMQCCALSIITDLCYLNPLPPVHIPDILAAVQQAEPHLTSLLRHVVAEYHPSRLNAKGA